MKIRAFLAPGVLTVASICVSIQAQQLAYDNGDLYPANPDHTWPAFNGGFGYNLWTPLADTGGGGTYNLGGGFAATWSGNLEASSTMVGSFAVINSSTG